MATIEKAVYRGRGLARHDGRVLLVPRGLPGDRLRLRISREHRDWSEASIEEVLTPSPDRRSAPCVHAERCGGCAYQELAYAAQLSLKASIVGESLTRARVALPGPVTVQGSPEHGWRSRVKLHARWADAGPQLGFYEPASHRLVAAERCRQLSAQTLEELERLRQAAAADPRLGRGLHAVEVAEPTQGAGRVLVLETDPAVRSRLDALPARLENTTGLMWRAPRRAHPFLAHGSPWLFSRVGGDTLRHHAAAFFQANRFLVDRLVEHVVVEAGGSGGVLDVYAGVGLFSVPLARRGRPVLAIEGEPRAADDARHNLTPLGGAVLENDVAAALADLAPAPDQTVVLDPPRSGAGSGVIAALAARVPARVVYVSCDPPTLARDLGAWAVCGYRLARLEAFDMFPDTFHVEVVATLVRHA